MSTRAPRAARSRSSVRCSKTQAAAGLCDEHMDAVVRGRGRPVGEVALLRARCERAEADAARLRAALLDAARGPIMPSLEAAKWRGVAVAAQAILVDYETMMRRGERPGLRMLVEMGLDKFRRRDGMTNSVEEAARRLCADILTAAEAP